MKRWIGIILVICFTLSMVPASEAAQKELSGTITLSGAWALYPMAMKWAEEFKKINPKVVIEVSAGGAGKGMADVLGGLVDIGMVSRGITQVEIDKGAWFVSVTKDAVVPTINAKNPQLKNLQKTGVTRQQLIDIWITGKITTWGMLLKNNSKDAISIYNRSDACGAGQTWAEYLGNKKQEELLGTGVNGDPGVTEAVRNDVLGTGYNNIGFAYDLKTGKPFAGICILPIDTNENGKIDPDENFYATRKQIVTAIATDKYPSPPARELYFVCKGKPTNQLLVSFIKWILTDGQKFVAESGYVNLSSARIKEQLNKLK